MVAKEPVLSTDNFKQPKVLTGEDAISTLLVRLILLEPGTIPSHPTMGVGLRSRYRYKFTNKLNDLRKDISEQVNTFLPQYRGADVTIEATSGKELVITIQIDGTLYTYETTSEDEVITGLTELI